MEEEVNGLEERSRSRTRGKKGIPFWIQLIALLVLILIMRNFILGTTYVKGTSMEPNFYHGDLLFVNKLATSLGSPEQGDVVICRLNEEGAGKNIVKRVIGLPGDEIDIVWNGDSENVEYYLYINGEEIDEPFLGEVMMSDGDLEYPYVVPENSYFVMGDNRNASSDSRKEAIGAIQKKDVIGKVVFRLFPFSRFGTIS